MEGQENGAIARRWFEEIFNTGNVGSIVEEIVAPDHAIHDPMNPHLALGPEGTRQLVRTWRGAFSDAYITIEDEIATADKVVHRWTATGTHDGYLGPVSATYALVSIDGITISRIYEGKLAETWNNFDVASLLNNIGFFSSGWPHEWKFPPW